MPRPRGSRQNARSTPPWAAHRAAEPAHGRRGGRARGGDGTSASEADDAEAEDARPRRRDARPEHPGVPWPMSDSAYYTEEFGEARERGERKRKRRGGRKRR